MIINLLRHSITKYNEEHLMSGGMVDAPLCANGIKLVKELKDKGIYPKDPGVLYCSSLCRSRQTLEIIYPDKDIVSSFYLDEYNFGEIEFLNTRAEINKYIADHPEYKPVWTDFAYKPIMGESIDEFLSRIKRGFELLYDSFCAKHYDKVTICTHGALLKGLFVIYDNPFELDPMIYLYNNAMGISYEVNKENGKLVFKPIGFIGGDCFEDVTFTHGFRK